MSSPGSVERVPLKVVPMFIDEQTVDLPPEPESEQGPQPDEPRDSSSRGPFPWVGVLAIVLGVAAAAAQVAAIVGATNGDFQLGIALGYLAVALAIAAVLAGITAIIMRRGRRAGIAGILIGIVANPLILLAILRFFDGSQR